uniref:4-hydroxybenzoate polyprenyltransferase n=1 Tax=Candidatus Kentrum sp. UNK TaxID=2126344 RepID=A0A451AGG1_9GAMM|nr:MAG: 4-hydroxybenzoate polyprenyltransferase [Candidatus Kentron sp. UNK]VFK71368.1 MAG: 4-hydroxybenzoate polyprenyltransferase [Candidatus Kentron sp. UNK]
MINKIVSPAIGYLIVALVCGLAGYFSNPDRIDIYVGELVLLALLLSFLFPVYLNRAILYEQKKQGIEGDRGRFIAEMGRGFPVFVFILALVLCLIIIFGTELNLPEGEVYLTIMLSKIFIALLPAYTFGLWNNYGWKKDKRVYFFRYRSFFPALATCILPFIYGWSNPNELYSITIASLTLLLVWGISLKLNLPKLSIFLVASFLILILLSVITRIYSFDLSNELVNFIQVFSFGVLMTLVMGVSESWRVSTRIRDDVEYGPRGIYEPSDINLYLSGANLAASLFLPFFLITFLHPSTTYPYIIGVSLLLCLQFLLWFSFSSKWKHATWSALGLFFGLALPILVSIGTNFNVKTVFINEALNIPSFFDVGGPITIFIGYMSYLGVWLKLPLFGNIFPKIKVRYFLEMRPCLALTGLSASVVLIIISFVPPILENAQDLGSIGDFFLARTRLLQIIYLVIIAVCALALFVKANDPEDGDSQVAFENQDKDVGVSSTLDRINYFVISGRPDTAFIVGIFSWLVIILNSSYHPVFAAFRVFPIVLVTMLGFILNDIFDLEKDRFSEKDRPIVSGKLEVLFAKKGVVYLCGLAIIWESVYLNISSFVVVFLALLGVFLYSPFSHKAPLFKGLWTSVLTCTPMFFSESVLQINVPSYLYGLLIVFVIGREWLMDVKDYEGDVHFGLKTIPYYLGMKRSIRISSTLMVGSLLFLLFSDIGMAAKIFATFGLLSLIYSIRIFSVYMEKSFSVSRLSLLFASISATLSI